MDVNRLQKELREIQGDSKSGVTVKMLSDSFARMQGTISGACAKKNGRMKIHHPHTSRRADRSMAKGNCCVSRPRDIAFLLFTSSPRRRTFSNPSFKTHIILTQTLTPLQSFHAQVPLRHRTKAARFTSTLKSQTRTRSCRPRCVSSRKCGIPT